MPHKILLAYDGSGSARKACDFAAEMAERYGAPLHVLAVARPPEFGTEVETEDFVERSRRHYLRDLKTVREQLARRSIALHVSVLVGHPAEQIVRYAEANGIDHIVVGHRGHTAFERWLLGSVARQVIAYANCAVTVVRNVRTEAGTNARTQ